MTTTTASTTPPAGGPRADVKLLPDGSGAGTAVGAGVVPAGGVAPVVTAVGTAVPVGAASVASPASPTGFNPRQLSELPRDELEHLAEEYGIDPTRHKTRQDLVAALHDRRQLIASLDRDAMLDCVRWGRRPVTANATKDQIAQEIARVRSMRFSGLSQRGLVVLARMRGVAASEADPVPELIKRLKKQEGLFAKISRKRRSWLAGVVANLLGEDESGRQYQFLPPASGNSGGPTVTPVGGGGGAPTIKEEIEESGLFGGITSRLKKTADSYVNQKLDEIEARIDRKLDEIDRRLAEWRDKEVANRIKILKITLWASVIVSVVSLIYLYVTVYFFPATKGPLPDPTPPQVRQSAQ